MSLVVEGLCKSYGGLAAVDGVSFTARPGQVTAVIGPNGAGKTTLLNLISGVVVADVGTVRLYDQNLTGALPHNVALAGLTRTFQSPQLFDGMTVLETVMVGAHIKARTSFFGALIRGPRVVREEETLERFAREALDRVGVPRKEFERTALDLPYGLQRRVEIARALAMEAKALLLDEPAAGLNGTEVDDIANLIDKVSHDDTIVVLVEHKMDMVMRISDHIVVMNFGRKIAEGTPEYVQRDNQVIEAYLGTPETVDA
jgi:branched-chain amino acid transport system ATP-binding protein